MPHTTRYHIFGRTVEVHLDDGVGGRVLSEELALYPESSSTAPAVSIRIGPVEREAPLALNPSLHTEHEAGFTARYTMATVDYRFNGDRLGEVSMEINVPPSALRREGQRFADMQFTTREMRAGMIFHELALVPATALDPERLLLHASALEAPDGTVTLFGGTGGVGKTSLCVELCLTGGHRFVADDITPLSLEGHAFPNLAYPKIYGYNLSGNSVLRDAVFADRGPLDHLHWHLHRLRGLDRVRRRASPEVLYGSYSREGGPIGRYILLAREHRSHLRLDPISSRDAAALSVAVLQAELNVFFNHLHWHVYNRRLLGLPPLVGPHEVVVRWEEGLRGALAGVECSIARIPVDMEHAAFKRVMREALQS